MNATCIIFGCIFLGIGLLLILNRIPPALSPLKYLSPKEREEIDVVPLCRNIGEIIGFAGILFLLNGFWQHFMDHWFSVSMIIWFLIAGLDLWYLSKKSHYQK